MPPSYHAFQAPVVLSQRTFSAPLAQSRVAATTSARSVRVAVRSCAAREDESDAASEVARLAALAADDVASRPQFYAGASGAAGAAVVLYVVLDRVVHSLDGIPLLPGALKLIGAAYSAFFVWRYLLVDEARDQLFEDLYRLLDEIR
jgi:CAAD domains of cyanobacterial aminoacyl-tRNA synthetase